MLPDDPLIASRRKTPSRSVAMLALIFSCVGVVAGVATAITRSGDLLNVSVASFIIALMCGIHAIAWRTPRRAFRAAYLDRKTYQPRRGQPLEVTLVLEPRKPVELWLGLCRARLVSPDRALGVLQSMSLELPARLTSYRALVLRFDVSADLKLRPDPAMGVQPHRVEVDVVLRDGRKLSLWLDVNVSLARRSDRLLSVVESE